MEIYFSNPIYLWLLAPIPLFVAIMILSIRRGKSEIGQFISFHALEFLFKKGDFISKYIKKNFLFFILRITIYSLIIFVITECTVYYNGIPREQVIVIAIDSSGSMLAEDIKPNRLEAVKETIPSFLEKIPPNAEIAILSFSGNVYIEQELSNKESSLKSIENIQISPISGTSIGTTLKTAADMLNKEKKPKLIVLVSDGSENIMGETALNQIIDAINKEHITVNVIGVGKIEGAKLAGVESPSSLNEPLLQNIAKKTKGIYNRAETKQSLTEAYENLATAKLKIPIRLTTPLVIISILLLLVDYAFIRLA